MIRSDDLRQMQRLAQTVWRLDCRLLGQTVGQLAYQAALAAARESAAADYRTWLVDGQCRAWGWFQPPAALEWAVHPASPSLLSDVLRWADGIAPSAVLETTARHGDEAGHSILRAHGFQRDEAAPWMRLNHRSVAEAEPSEVTSGYRLTTVAEHGGDISRRVAVHQRSWAELGTRVSAETYSHVMATWPYRPDVDFMLEMTGGTVVAFALAWYDDENGVAELEPIGVAPDYRRRGLGRLLLRLALERLRELGATDVLVGSRGDAAYPVPTRLYESVGFRELSRDIPFVRRRHPQSA